MDIAPAAHRPTHLILFPATTPLATLQHWQCPKWGRFQWAIKVVLLVQLPDNFQYGQPWPKRLHQSTVNLVQQKVSYFQANLAQPSSTSARCTAICTNTVSEKLALAPIASATVCGQAAIGTPISKEYPSIVIIPCCRVSWRDSSSSGAGGTLLGNKDPYWPCGHRSEHQYWCSVKSLTGLVVIDAQSKSCLEADVVSILKANAACVATHQLPLTFSSSGKLILWVMRINRSRAGVTTYKGMPVTISLCMCLAQGGHSSARKP